MNAPVTWYEVRNVIFSMKPLEAPGPDGFQPGFYQRYWDKIGGSIFNFIKKCMMDWNFPKDRNTCFITLIPKIENPENIMSFRPITLYNVSYKILTKILVNRIRPILDKIIGPNQSSFLPGRQTVDNVIIT